MSLIVYPAVVSQTEPQAMTATLPDFEDLTVAASSPGDLLLVTRQHLSQRLREMEKAGESWPTPSTLAAVRADHPATEDAVVWVDVSVEDTPIRVTISLGERLLAQIDGAAESYALTRSGFLAACARRQIATGVSPLVGDASQRLYEDVAAAGRKIQDVLGPDSPVGRTLAELDSIAVDGLRRLAGGVSTAMRASKKVGPEHD